MEVKKLTVASACFYDNELPAQRLIHSCEKFNLNLSLYGIKQFGDNWRNMKVVKLLEHLESIESEYVLYTDASDSWMLFDEETIIKKFKKHEADILISGERNVYPEISREYPKSYTSIRYLCAGSFMGKTECVKYALKLLLKYPEDSNDQLLWHHLFLDEKMNIKIDYTASVFLSMCGIDLDAISIVSHANNPPVILLETDEYPCVIHFNGGKGGSQNELNMIRAWELTK